ncbi:MAG: EamA family transporter [Synergistaceae bacterium]|jgi:drug/metabolite transporter (DMT)-like permease|nr:EamA family transporter [Synergistaceae bacterium]
MTDISNNRPSKASLVLAYLLVYIIWGSTYLAIRFSVETIPPFFSGGTRFLIAGLILLIGRSLHSGLKTTLQGWKYAFGASLLPFVITYGLITSAERVVPSSLAALLISIEPLWFCVIGWLFYNGGRPTRLHYLGIFLGFLGVFILVKGDPNADFSFKSAYLFWVLMLIVSGLTWVIGAFISRNPKIHEDSLMSSGMQMLCGGAVMMAIHFIVSAFTGDYQSISAFSSKSIYALLYLITFGSLVGYSSFLWLMRVEPANRVATHAFVNPIVAVFLGWLIGGEPLGLYMLVSTPLIIASVVLMIWQPKKRSS